MIINNNTSSTGALSALNASTQQHLEKLSSGYRINSAADDAAGLAIAEKLAAQITGQSRAMSNVQDGISFVGVGEGAMGEVHSMLNRMKDLAVQSGNGILDDGQRSMIQNEMISIMTEIDRISSATNFNGKAILDGSLDSSNGGEGMVFQIGDTADGFNQMQVDVSDMSSAGLGLSGLSVGNAADAMDALSRIDDAINMVSANRGNLGAAENRLEHAYNSLSVTNENVTASQSRIKDTDMAKEIMNYVKNDVLRQSNFAMQAQSNLQAAQVLQLLR